MTTAIQTTALADGLRALAAMCETQPEAIAAANLHWWFETVNVPVSSREAVKSMARAGLKAGATVTKHQDDKYAGVNVSFGAVSLRVFIDREEICEKVVTGTREVTEEVPDPQALAAVPKVTVTRTEEITEWRCMPLLGARDDEPTLLGR